MRSNAFASFLAAARIVDLVVEDEISRPAREWVGRRWPDSKVAYLTNCKKCVSVWAGFLVASGIVPRPVVSALALSQSVIWIDRQDDRVSAIVSAQVRKLTRS